MSPSLDPKQNVSGISSVTQFIISNNPDCHYIHFELGRKDNDLTKYRHNEVSYFMEQNIE